MMMLDGEPRPRRSVGSRVTTDRQCGPQRTADQGRLAAVTERSRMILVPVSRTQAMPHATLPTGRAELSSELARWTMFLAAMGNSRLRRQAGNDP